MSNQNKKFSLNIDAKKIDGISLSVAKSWLKENTPWDVRQYFNIQESNEESISYKKENDKNNAFYIFSNAKKIDSITLSIMKKWLREDTPLVVKNYLEINDKLENKNSKSQSSQSR